MALLTIIKSVDRLDGRRLVLTTVFQDDRGVLKDAVRSVLVTNTTEAGVRAALRAERDTVLGFDDVEPKIPLGVPYDIDVDAPQPPGPPTPDQVALQAWRAADAFLLVVRHQQATGYVLVTDKIVSDALADANSKFRAAYIGNLF